MSSLPIWPGQGRVPYVPLPRREPAYTGKIVVTQEDGIVEDLPYGRFVKLLCEATTGDERFTVGERIIAPGASSGRLEADSEAVHVLAGAGTLRVWLDKPPGRQMDIPLQPGLEVVVTEGTRHQWVNDPGAEMLTVVTISHEPFPAYPHHYPAIFKAGEGNEIHQHDNRVEGFYVVSGPGSMVIANPDNTDVQTVVVPPRAVGFKPLYVYHRQFNHAAPGGDPCFWIHSMVVFTHRGSRMPQIHVRQHELDGMTPRWEHPTT